jgi:glycosyltransferase involved in cell wall biosynthesis
MSLPNLLFVTPSLPSPRGTGSMLRAAMTLDALSRRFRVHVLNLNVWSWGTGNRAFMQSRAVSYAELPTTQADINTPTLLQRHFANVNFAAIHTFRLVMARVTIGILAAGQTPNPYLVLDLDDDECARSSGMLALMEHHNDLPQLKRARADQAQLRMLERMMVPRFNAICLAGMDDCHALASRYPRVAVHHLPNAIDLPETHSHITTPAADLLFVGALYYAPNADGICHFVEQVLPLIQQTLPTVTLKVIGADPLPRVSALAQNPAVTVHPNVPSVAPFYHEASLCIVPLRAGSGTRIKILEAFSFHRPVVSTRLGAEGLDLVDGEHLLIAEEPEAMAQACISLLNDHALRTKIINSAYAWVARNHSIANVQTAIDTIYQPVLAP